MHSFWRWWLQHFSKKLAQEQQRTGKVEECSETHVAFHSLTGNRWKCHDWVWKEHPEMSPSTVHISSKDSKNPQKSLHIRGKVETNIGCLWPSIPQAALHWKLSPFCNRYYYSGTTEHSTIQRERQTSTTSSATDCAVLIWDGLTQNGKVCCGLSRPHFILSSCPD